MKIFLLLSLAFFVAGTIEITTGSREYGTLLMIMGWCIYNNYWLQKIEKNKT